MPICIFIYCLFNLFLRLIYDYLYLRFCNLIYFVDGNNANPSQSGGTGIYSDNNFESGEVYYTTKTHDNLVYYRIPYSFIIYSICILGFVNLLKQKKYNIIALLIVSIIYFYSLVMWHGNTRYFVPNLIYMSIFFGYGASFIKDRLEAKLKKKELFN